MNVAIDKLLMNLLLGVLRLLDGVMVIFRKLAGLDPVSEGGPDLVGWFMDNPTVHDVFWNIFIIGVVVTAIAMIVAIIKAFVNLNGGERKPISKITGQGIGTVFITLLMAGILISGITMANSFLREVSAAFNIDDNYNICNDLFEIAVNDNAYIWVPDEWEWEVETDINGNPIKDINGNPVYKLDENSQKIPVYVKDGDGNIIYDSAGNKTQVVKQWRRDPVPDADSGWTKTGTTIKQTPGWSILNEDADTVLGKYPHDLFNPFENPDKTPTMEGLIYYGSFDFILGYFAAVIVLVALVSACLGLGKRVYDLVILFLSLPLIASTIPLDDGARFKVWRETVISKVILAYGAVFAVNIFMIMLPMVTAMPVDGVGGNILKMLLIVCGGLSISGGMMLFARLFGTDAAESRDVAQSARTLLAGAGAGIAGIKGTLKSGNAGRKWLFGVNDEKLAEKRKLGALRRFGQFLGNGNGSLANAKLGLTGNGGASASLTPQSQAGSSLGQTMKTAGAQRFRDDKTGRFISNLEAAKRGMTGSTGVKK